MLNSMASEKYVKKLVLILISSIAKQRDFFPEEAYVDHQIEGIPMKILRQDCTLPAAAEIAACVKGAFEAIRKKYVSHYGFFIL
jgi:hypothetical protein